MSDMHSETDRKSTISHIIYAENGVFSINDIIEKAMQHFSNVDREKIHRDVRETIIQLIRTKKIANDYAKAGTGSYYVVH